MPGVNVGPEPPSLWQRVSGCRHRVVLGERHAINTNDIPLVFRIHAINMNDIPLVYRIHAM